MRKFSSKQFNLVALALLLCSVACWFHLTRKPAVTILGLSLEHSREQVGSIMRGRDHRNSTTDALVQHWHRMESSGVDVHYTEDDRIWKMESSSAEIYGEDASEWTLEDIIARLGPARISESGPREGHRLRHLSYPEHKLLITQEHGRTRFTLFLGKDT